MRNGRESHIFVSPDGFSDSLLLALGQRPVPPSQGGFGLGEAILLFDLPIRDALRTELEKLDISGCIPTAPFSPRGRSYTGFTALTRYVLN